MAQFSFTNYKKQFMLVLAGVAALATVVFAFAVFTDYVNRTTKLQTASFDADGYTIDVSAPEGYFAANDTVDIILEESNEKSKDIFRQVAMMAAWESPVPNAYPWDDISITIDGDVISHSVNEDQTISFTLPEKALSSGSSGEQSNLSVQLPADLAATGTIKFSFEQIELHSGEWTYDYDKDKLSALNFEIGAAWNISKDQTTALGNPNRDIIALLGSGAAADEYTLNIIKNGSDTNTNYGQMMNWTSAGQTPWANYNITELNLSEGLTTVGSYAFAEETGITTHALPSTVHTVGMSAFEGSGLSGELTLPSTITIIDYLAFGDLPNVDTITFEHGSDDSLTLPDNTSEGEETSGAFYVTDYVKTTLNFNGNTVAENYDWVADHRMKVGISEVILSYEDVSAGKTVMPSLTISPTNYDDYQSIKYELTSGNECAEFDPETGALTGIANGSVAVQVTIVDANGNTVQASADVSIARTPIAMEDAEIGSTVMLDVDGTPTEFIIVHQGNPDNSLYDASCDGTWLLMKDGDSTNRYFAWDEYYDSYYDTSDIALYLKYSFITRLDSDVQTAIQHVKIPYATDVEGSVATGSNGFLTKVFLLSARELGWSKSGLPSDGSCLAYFSGTSETDSKRIAYFSGTADGWWLRSTPIGIGGNAMYVSHTGSLAENGQYVATDAGVRPALILPSDAIIDSDGAVSVDHLIMDSASVTKQPNKTTYTEGEDFDPTGMEVTVTYKDGSTKTISAEDLTVADGSELSADQTEVTILYSENDHAVEVTVSITVEKLAIAMGDAEIGDIVYLNENGSPVEYIIVHQGNPDSTLYDNSCDGTWLLRKDVYGKSKFSSGHNAYADSTAHTYLNSTFLHLLDADVQAQIKTVKIPYTAYETISSGVTSIVEKTGANGLSTQVFLLSGNEVGFGDVSFVMPEGACLEYFNGAANTARKAYLNGSAAYWWLRTPYNGETKYSCVVSTDGGYGSLECQYSYGVRPALILPSDAIIDSDGTVSVDHLIMDSASVTKQPNKTTYTEGEDFDPTGMEVTVTYKDGSTKTISADALTVTDGSELSADQTEVTISYIQNGQTVEVTVPITVEKLPIAMEDAEIGDVVYLNENGKPVEYIVVNQGVPGSSKLYDSSCDGTWLLRRDVHSERAWHSVTLNNYSVSTIRTYLEGDFFDLYDEDVQTFIKQVKLPYVNGAGGAEVASGSNGISAKVFLLSAYEVGFTQENTNYGVPIDGACLSYFSTTAEDENRLAYYNDTVTEWWLRSPYVGNTGAALSVSTYGGWDAGNASVYSFGVRPALILPSDVIIDSDGTVSVDHLIMDSASVTKQPNKTTYTEGEDFDPSGMEVTVTYKDGSTKTISADNLTVTDGSELSADQTEVTISYIQNGQTVEVMVPITVEKLPIAMEDAEIGSTVMLDVDGTPTEFIIVHQGKPNSTLYDTSCDGTWLLMKDIYVNQQWAKSSGVDYSASTVHSYLNEDLLSKFNSAVQTIIKEVKILYSSGTIVENGLKTKVFLLSGPELGLSSAGYGEKLDYFMDGTSAEARALRYATMRGEEDGADYWTRGVVNTATNDSAYYIQNANTSSPGNILGQLPTRTCGVRPALILPGDVIINGDGSLDVSNVYFDIDSEPSQSGTLTYTGKEQTVSWDNYDSTQLTLSGTTSATDSGTYTAIFTPKEQYRWSDGTTDSKEIEWTIGKAEGSLSLSVTTIELDEGDTTTIEATRIGDGTISATSSNTSVATASVDGTTITVTGVTAGTATITVTVAEGTNYKAASKTCATTVTASGYTVTFKVGQGADWGGWVYGFNCEYYYQEYGYESYIQYSLDGGSSWIDIPPDESKTAKSTITTLTGINSIMFKCYVSGGRASYATVGTTYSGNEIVPYVSPGTETISDEITLSGDTTFYLALAYSTAY